MQEPYPKNCSHFWRIVSWVRTNTRLKGPCHAWLYHSISYELLYQRYAFKHLPHSFTIQKNMRCKKVLVALTHGWSQATRPSAKNWALIRRMDNSRTKQLPPLVVHNHLSAARKILQIGGIVYCGLVLYDLLSYGNGGLLQTLENKGFAVRTNRLTDSPYWD